MDLLRAVFVDPFVQMIAAPDLLAQTIWEGFVGGVLYSLIALGFVLIYKASGVFNFAQGIMIVFAALMLVGLYEKGVPAWIALLLTVAVMYGLAVGIERLVLRPLVNQPDIILLMATFGVTYFLIGFGELVFGGNPKSMIAKQLWLPDGSIDLHILGGKVEMQKLDIAAAAIALIMVAGLALFFQKTRIGRALRAVADDRPRGTSPPFILPSIARFASDPMPHRRTCENTRQPAKFTAQAIWRQTDRGLAVSRSVNGRFARQTSASLLHALRSWKYVSCPASRQERCPARLDHPGARRRPDEQHDPADRLWSRSAAGTAV